MWIIKIKCWLKGHLWIEWDHSPDRPKREFVRNTVELKDPECVRCGIRKSNLI